MSGIPFNPVETIERKRDGRRLSAEEIEEFIRRYAAGQVPDYQMAAFAMAVYLRGMSLDETVCLTGSMLRSGWQFTWPVGSPVVDKHSTGGVGDKVSLVLTPLLACCGLRVPMISGRALGITGGTLDKLESIPGFRTDLSVDEIRRQVEQVGCVITGATDELVPADRKLYALRNVTGTVGSIPLITASILSKKLAESLDALVLDVKCGRGTFMKTPDEALRLARCLVTVADRMGTRVTALITNMDQPLGQAVGNAVEVKEAIDVLKGEGPEDVWSLTVELAVEVLELAGEAEDRQEARRRLEDLRRSGKALEKFEQMVRAQGGDLSRPLTLAPETLVAAGRSGIVVDVNAGSIGQLVAELGGGRRRTSDQVDHSVGVKLAVHVGDRVETGSLLARVFARPDYADYAQRVIGRAVRIEETPVAPPALVLSRIGGKRQDMDTDGQLLLLEREARAARERAYAPYSRYRVGAAVLTDDGQIFSGANVECASYGLTLCAERVAIARAVSSGARRVQAAAVVAEGKAAPCGACLQMLAEFCDDASIVLIDANGKSPLEIKRLSELLRDPFRL